MTTMLDRPTVTPTYPLLSNVTPNWFASVMGTGIVANAAATLPHQVPGLHVFGTVVWAAAAVWLVVLAAATVGHHVRYPEVARRHHLDPVMSHFYGAPAMALLTVGAGALLLGKDVIGTSTAVVVDAVLWTAGTLLGLATAIGVPYLAFTRHARTDAFGGWLMPVVPPMVSASTGALLLPHVPAGEPRLDLLMACYALFGISLVLSLVVTTLMWARMTRLATPPKMVPTVWIALGWMGQSVTAVNLLGAQAPSIVPAPYGRGFQALGLVYGVPVWGLAAVWTTICVLLTVRTLRSGMPFSLTWWSFTFPVGTFVTGTTGLAAHTGSTFFGVAAVVLYAALVAAWAVVAVRTAAGLRSRSILTAPASFELAA